MAIVGVLIVPLPASAQTLYGSIVGTVRTARAPPFPARPSTATNTGTGLKVETVTDADGAYAFRNLLPGVYDLNGLARGLPRAEPDGPARLRRQPRPRRAEARGRRARRDRQRRQRDDAAADGEGRPAHRADVEGHRQPAAQPVPELPAAHQPGARRDARAVPERRDRHPRPLAAHLGERRAAEQQRDPHRRRGVGQRLAAPPRRLRPARGDRSRPSTSRPTTSTPTRAWPAARR